MPHTFPWFAVTLCKHFHERDKNSWTVEPSDELIKYILNTDEKADILEYGSLVIQNPVQCDKEIKILKDNKEK